MNLYVWETWVKFIFPFFLSWVFRVLFLSLMFLRIDALWKELVCFFKLLLLFLILVNYEGPYLVERFHHNLRPCLDIAFAELEVITRTRNKFVGRVAVAECFLIVSYVKNKESNKQPFRIYLTAKSADRRTPVKKKSIAS